jgi:hypothetical protein
MTIPPDLLDYLASNLTQKDIDAMLREQAWSALTIQQQKQAIQKVIDRILVYKDHIRVHLTVDPVLFTAHSLTKVRRARVIQDELMGMDEKPDTAAICRHAMDMDKAKGQA